MRKPSKTGRCVPPHVRARQPPAVRRLERGCARHLAGAVGCYRDIVAVRRCVGHRATLLRLLGSIAGFLIGDERINLFLRVTTFERLGSRGWQRGTRGSTHARFQVHGEMLVDSGALDPETEAGVK